eukprot:COSAG04_NODE_362_length_15842_cov_47.166614_2_plen_91_part_00
MPCTSATRAKPQAGGGRQGGQEEKELVVHHGAVVAQVLWKPEQRRTYANAKSTRVFLELAAEASRTPLLAQSATCASAPLLGAVFSAAMG